MATRKISHGGKEYEVVAEPYNGKFITRIDPEGRTGRYIREPDTQVTDPATGKTTTKQGKPVEFDTEKGALDAGEDNVKRGMV